MKAIITEIIQETPDISSFKLQPEQPLKHTPGQWMYVRLSPELKHHFTISSSPTEKFLMFTTKKSDSDYKETLWGKVVGDEVEINGSFGSFTLDATVTSSRLFIAGGIGITPFRSMLKYIADKKLDIRYHLLYSAKSIDEIAYRDEMSSWPNITINESSKSGHLNENRVMALVPDYVDRDWWVCGPPAMVESIVGLGKQMGLPPEKIKSEEFTGY